MVLRYWIARLPWEVLDAPWDFEQPDLVEGVPAQYKGVGIR